MNKRAALNFASSLMYQFVNLLIGLILPKFYTEAFGSVYNGLNQSVSQIMSLLSVLQFGIAAAAIQQMFKYIADKDEDTIRAIYWESGRQYRKMGYFFIGIVIPVIAIFPFIIKDNLSYLIVVAFLLFRTISSAMEYFFQAKYGIILTANNKTYAIYVINTVLLLLGTALHFVVLFTIKNILIYQGVAVVTTLVRLLIVSTYVRKKFPYLYKKSDKKIELPKENRRKDVLISEIAGMAIDSTDMIVLSTFSGLVFTSIYSIYNFVVTGIGSVLASCREAVFAGLGKLFYKDFDEFKKEFDSFESIYLFLVFLLYSITIILFKPFIEIYTANMDAEYYYVGFPIMFILAKMLVNLRIPAIVSINTAGHFKEVRNYAVIEAIINLVLSLILVQFFDIYGVLIGTIVGSLYRTPILIRYANKNILKRKSFKYVKKILLWLPFFVGAYLISIFVPIKCTSLINWVLIAIPIAAAVFICSIIWVLITDRSTFKKLFRRVKRIFKGKRKTK
ncbi:MAG: hypothetical protein J6A95_06000 [Clostridia bacterium]|nr:hypothetical protein [Clostridia bacterium]